MPFGPWPGQTGGGGGGFPGFGPAPPRIATASSAGAAATASRSDHTHAFDFPVYAPTLAGMQLSGVIQQTFAAGNATPSVLTMGVNQVPYGLASGLLTASGQFLATVTAATTTLEVNGTNSGLLVMNATTSPSLQTLFGVRWRVAGVNFAQLSASQGNGAATHNLMRIQVTPLAGGDGLDKMDWTITGLGQTAAGIGLNTTAMDAWFGSNVTVAVGSTTGFLWLPTVNGPPTGVPSLVGNDQGSRNPVIIDNAEPSGIGRIYVRNQAAGAWHYTTLDDYYATATRVAFGAATAGQQTDSANLTFTVATGILQSPLFVGNTLGGFGGGLTLTLENNHAAPTVSMSLLVGTATLTGGFLWTIATGIFRSPLVETNTVGGFGGGGTLTFENNHAAPASSINLTGTDIQVTVPAVSGLVPTAANTSIGTAANYWGGGFIGGIHCLSIQAADASGISMSGIGGSVVVNIDDDAISITPAPGLQAETAAAAQAGTLGNLPTATGGGDPDKYFQVQKAGTTYVIPAWAV